MKRTIKSIFGFGKINSDQGYPEAGSLGKEIAASLPGVPEERLRYLVAFGGLLGAVADADGEISTEELSRIRAILKSFVGLTESEAQAVSRIVAEQTRALSGIEDYLYTREINELADVPRKIEIVSCLFAVAATDESISPEENEEIRRISLALLLRDKDFIAVRSLYRDKLSVLKSGLD